MKNKIKIGEVATFNRGFQVPRSRTDVDYDIPYLHYGDIYKIYNNKINLSEAIDSIIKIKSNEKFKKDHYLLHNDIVFNLTSENYEDLGKTVIIKNKNNQQFVSGMETTKCRIVKPDVLNPDYFQFLTQSKLFKATLLQYVTGMKVFRVHPRDISQIEIEVPSLDSQIKISHILNAITSKIEINNQINEKLEETAKALYKEWFVNFNFPDENGLPYKDNGGEFYETELGEIPVGWTVTPLNQVFDFLEGPGIRNWQYTEKGVKFLNIRLIKNNDLDLESANMVSEDEAYGRYKHFLLEENDIIVSTSGTLGKYAVIRKEHLPIMLNTSIIRFRPIEKDYFGFMYQYLKSNSFYKELITKSSGSVQLNFGPTHLKEINIIKPPKYIIDKFNLIVRDFIFKSLKLKSENSNLKEVLNLLINKLMQGKINIDELDIDWNNLNKTLKEIEGI